MKPVSSGEAALHALVARAAEAGRLRVSVPHATRLIAAAGHGGTLSLLSTPPEARDPRLSDSLREAVLAAITVAPPSESPPARPPARDGWRRAPWPCAPCSPRRPTSSPRPSGTCWASGLTGWRTRTADPPPVAGIHGFS